MEERAFEVFGQASGVDLADKDLGERARKPTRQSLRPTLRVVDGERPDRDHARTESPSPRQISGIGLAGDRRQLAGSVEVESLEIDVEEAVGAGQQAAVPAERLAQGHNQRDGRHNSKTIRGIRRRRRMRIDFGSTGLPASGGCW